MMLEVEGGTPAWCMKIMRHEAGHVFNYAYRLYDQEEWVKQFGSITQPYSEEYRPEPFSRSYVRHLPGWYAQKHPDEDWSETFAVWMTPGLDWKKEYGGWPVAAAKLGWDPVAGQPGTTATQPIEIRRSRGNGTVMVIRAGGSSGKCSA